MNKKYLIISIFVLVFGVLINQGVSFYLENKYPNLPVLNDLVLDNIPYVNLVFWYDVIWLVSIGIFLVYAIRTKKDLPFIILVFGISNIVRGLFIGLTPFGSPKIDETGLFVGSSFRAGVYPSGHTGTSFLAFMLSKGKTKIILFFVLLLLISSLLLGRGHYAVDIFSALIFNYAILCFADKYFKNFRD